MATELNIGNKNVYKYASCTYLPLRWESLCVETRGLPSLGEGHQKLKVGFPPGTLSKKLVSRPGSYFIRYLLNQFIMYRG